MSDIIDKLIGVYHFISDRPPRQIPLVDPKLRGFNPWCRNGQAIVSKVVAGGDIKVSVDNSLSLLGHLGQAISTGDRVLVKPNFNSQDPFPGSTDLAFLRVVVELLIDAGARVTIGESAGGIWRPTRKVFHKLGVFDV